MHIIQKKTIFVILLVALLAIWTSFELNLFSSNEPIKVVTEHPSENKEQALNLSEDKPKIESLKLSIEPISVEIETLNDYIEENISPIGTSLKPGLFSTVFEDINNGFLDVDLAAEQLKEIMLDPQKHQLEMRELFGYCDALKKRVTGITDDSTQSTLFGEDILLALQKSEYCSYVGTVADPFYIILNLARKGDKIAQLYLIDDLYFAIQRGLINPNINPLEYYDLRTEIIDYLVTLSSSGVVQASINLQKLYSTSNFLVPVDKVLAYFYAVLVEKQSNGQMIYDYPSNQLYERLTESQKQRADRITKRFR